MASYMKSIAILLACLINILPVLALAEESLIGIWSATTRTKGGLGSQWTFIEGGEVSYTFGALVDFKFEIDNDSLNINLIGAEIEGNNIIKQQFSINEDTLTIYADGSKEPQIMKWAGVPVKSNHPIIGNWTYTHYTGQPALMRYSSHGLTQLTVPFIVENGTYSIHGDKLLIKFRDKEPIEYKFIHSDKILTIQEADSEKITKFQLFEY